jgi:hypothetical protein
MIRMLLMLSLITWFFKPTVALACQPMNASELQDKLKRESVAQLVFFASWCSSCKQHLTEAYAAKSLFIASFDENQAATKAFRAFLGEAHRQLCIWDKDGSIAAHYAVKSLPALRALGDK